MTDYALTVCEVSCTRLAGVSVALLPGEITGVVGPAGAGKSTLLQVASGCVTPDAGEALICGMPAASAAARRLVGYARELPTFPPALTVREVLGYYARLHAGDEARTARGLVREALELAGLAAVADLRVSTLGRADLQRLALAQAALGGRRVLLLDETLSGLDAVARRDLCGRLVRLAAAGVAVLLAARDLAALERVAGRVLVLRAGRVARAGPLAALLAERVLEVILDAPPPEPPPGFRVTAAGIEAPLAGRTAEAALALCRAHRLAVRASRVRVKSLEEIVLETHDRPPATR
ncbi:MAG TPA: ABC transporter ATP-binding protein [Gemmatimonadales bacterium]|nr:ABC transporter ATP-binding protein [Gemmatimonadales bacterium]